MKRFTFLFCATLMWASKNTYSMEIGSRIFNGKEAKKSQFPFQVGLTITNSQQTYFCSGTILAEYWILTSAVCIYGATSVVVHAGSISLSDSQTFYAEKGKIIPHPMYNPDDFNYNIGLIKVNTSLANIGSVSTLVFPDSLFDNQPYFSATITGWGQTSNGKSNAQFLRINEKDEDSTTNILHFIDVNMTTADVCKIYYGSDIDENVVCTDVGQNSLKNPCVGDAGAPLLYKDTGGYSVIGILNFINGYKCDYPYPAVFTKITKDYNKWISDKQTEYSISYPKVN